MNSLQTRYGITLALAFSLQLQGMLTNQKHPLAPHHFPDITYKSKNQAVLNHETYYPYNELLCPYLTMSAAELNQQLPEDLVIALTYHSPSKGNKKTLRIDPIGLQQLIIHGLSDNNIKLLYNISTLNPTEQDLFNRTVAETKKITY